MSVAEALRNLGHALERYEGEGSITSVELTGDEDPDEPRSLSAEIELSTRPPETDGWDVSLHGTSVDSGGRLRLAFESVSPIVPTDDDIDTRVTDVSVAREGGVTVTLSASVPVEDGAVDRVEPVVDGAVTTAEETPADPLCESDVPPFRDTELLADVYHSCDTFAEMVDELGMDVTAETVRRYMIDQGIHEPDSYDTGGVNARAVTAGAGEPDGPEVETPGTAAHEDADSQVVLADGIGLPDDVTVEALVETVKRSNTIFEVEQEMGMEREEALEMLRDLDLLDLVVGRLATKAERDIGRDEVVERLRQTSATS